ncbi:uncharacterized protein M421DRAFT_91249 [Didymella exigua CBS 183.55]|uniref:Peptidase S59 domain-containing protein n=1 Tax=Didymella exigua CBS 183.55 TaxID=1150837 RepID=A0A6A5RRH9_9PLEO|nr:uncharacterized protein M421DRAFT_91249 [Didymella exigua CBS 183.55]KAF1930053.1 hypothetical protein M421DRAFT_91249 [Didymella exigua CBS 183.55]
MSFGGGGFGFGGSNTNNQSTGFGFGGTNNNNNSGGFGSNTGAFGSNNNTGGGMFGGNNNTTSAFGSGGGFGANNNAPKTTFGSNTFGAGSTGGGLFGGGASNTGSTFGSGGGGFGAASNTSSGFGGGATTGTSLFGGASKPAFGAGSTTNTGGGLFGGGSGGFGAGNTTGGFGSGTTGGFGAGATNTTNNGTASTPFQAHTEKDGTSATQHYQTITFQQPYQNFSLEELRLADYNQGRRYGNSNGQGGAFGQSSTFGGFGAANNNNANANTTSAFGSNNTNTGGGLFGGGGTTNTTGGFGQSTGGFGAQNNANTGGGLFGAKPATGGLFGGSNTATTGTTGGGLFGGGSTTNTTGGFGGGGGGFGAANTNTGGGLFGNNNAAKPAFGAGATNTSTGFGASTGGGFGQSTNTGGGLFGGNNNQASAAPAFGGAPATANTGGGLFGNAGSTFGQNNTAQAPASGGLFGGGGGFAANNNQAKPATGGLFGSGSTTTNTGGGLFGGGAPAQQPAAGGLFGGSTTTNNNAGGGLFGGAKPATGGGLFGGGASTQQPASGGLFGNLGGQNNQQNAGSSLFGGNNNQQKPGGLFGSSTTNNTGGGLFGGLGGQNNNQQQNNLGGSLFGGGQSQQQQGQQQMGNSLFGASGSSLLNTSLNTNPYGNDALFAGLATPTQSPGPIATPLSSSQKNKKSAILPQHKLNPAASTRLLTPQAKRTGGYGFTYSTYGSPASGQATPNLGGSLFAGGGLSRSLGSRSTSMSNLRNSFTPETSILAPGAFSTTGRSFANGSLKKLNVNRHVNTRIPLFDEPSHKRVSFAGGDGDSLSGSTNGSTALVVREEDSDASPTSVNGNASLEPSRPAMQQVNGTELAQVPEHDPALTPKSASVVNVQPGEDPEPGHYWSEPTLNQLKKMSKQELKAVKNFIVGRQNIGQIEFHQGAPVDLSNTDLDKLYGDIIQLSHRNATVYGENCSCLPKPPMGTGLNHPSRVILLNSWPRNKAGKMDAKHLERLKRVAGTKFESYNPSNGGWIFTVPHFSSYGLDYEDRGVYDDDEEDESSELSPVPDTPAQTLLNTSQMTSTPQQDSLVSPYESSPDDTFEFKRGMPQRANVPGGFDDEAAYEEEYDDEDSRGESFLGERSVGSLDGQQEAEYYESESGSDQDQSMADSVSGPIYTTEPAAAVEFDPFRSTMKAPKSILKASQVFKPNFGTPSKGPAVFDDDWANQLQRTISPRKQDRTALRESQGHALREYERSPTLAAQQINVRPFATHMDLMNSLFGETENHRESLSKRQGQGIELPYSKRPKSSHDLDQMTDADKDFHNSSKPHFSETGVFIYSNKGGKNLESGAFSTAQEPLVGATCDIRFTKMPTFGDAVPETIAVQKKVTKISTADGVPLASITLEPVPIEFAAFSKAVAVDSVAGTHEQHAWQLLSLLFDGGDKVNKPVDVDDEHLERYRKERLSDFWRNLVYGDAQKQAQQAATAEERAIAQLSCNNVAEACHALLEGLDLRLATMIAQIGGDANMRQTMTEQIDQWRRMDMLAEMEDAHRALYELLSGNCAQADGKDGNGRENRAVTFSISKRFSLDWRRAFGLRLWYGTLVDEPIELAVAQFADAIRDGLEDVKPVPWFVRDGADMGWVDPKAADREDLLWGILKLYAASKLDIPANVEDVLAPENVSGHPLNARLSFQLFQLFYSRHQDNKEDEWRKIGMPTFRADTEGDFRHSFMSSTATVTNNDTQGEDPLVELGDKITLSYAASLHTQEYWTAAVWVYTHLSSAPMREHYIRSLVNQFAKSMTLAESDSTYAYLTNDLHVPATWLHAAAALQAKTDGDAGREAAHLIKANELDEAHEVLCRKVGPDAIISRDYEPLRELMAGFVPEDANDSASLASSRPVVSARGPESVAGWAQGGQIYLDYIELLDHTGRRSTYRVDEELEQDIQHLLAKLQKALEIAARDRLESCGLEERVALMEIAGTVANLIAKNKTANRSQILRLPLTEDLWLKHSCDLSTSYYRNLMASSK